MKVLLVWIFVSIYLVRDTDGSQCGTYDRAGKINDPEKKKFLNCLSDKVDNRQSDLMIVLDTSGSMAASGHFQGQTLSGFQIAKNFIKSLLSEVRIAFNATRISVVTFESTSHMRLNYIIKPTFANNKCKFNKDFSKIPFDGGMTDLKGGLAKTYNEILLKLGNDDKEDFVRPNTHKVVILLSDGEGNMVNGAVKWPEGRFATKEANDIKHTNFFVTLYTVAVTDGADEEILRKIASTDSAFLKTKTFSEMAALASNIRGDPYEHDYDSQPVQDHYCQSCDQDATCGCNLLTGKPKCVCKLGYYGTAEKKTNDQRSCFPCAHNTYGEKRGYPTGCPKCPDNSETVQGKIATSVSECKCKVGYRGKIRTVADTCSYLPCVSPPGVSKARMVNETACLNGRHGTFCHYLCIDGYKFTANSRKYVQCFDMGGVAGQWDTPLPTCERIECSANWIGAKDSNRFTVQCNDTYNTATNSYQSTTSCSFTCKDKYYRKEGSETIACLKTGQWDSPRSVCEETKCAPITPSKYLMIKSSSPNNCFQNELAVGDLCYVKCSHEFTLKSLKPVLQCKATPNKAAVGEWNVDHKDLACEDNVKPKFDYENKCNGLTIYEVAGETVNYATFKFDFINVTDNSGEIPTLTCKKNGVPCDFKPGDQDEIPITNATGVNFEFEAMDQSNNVQTCTFRVVVSDETPPKLISCPKKIEKTTDQNKIIVNWTEPIFSDNCGKYPDCNVKSLPSVQPNSEFHANSKVLVQYTIEDPSGNKNTDCVFNVNIIQKVSGCTALSPPINGLVVMFTPAVAQMKCQRKRYPTAPIPFMYLCDTISKTWSDPMKPGIAVIDLPECTSKTPMDAAMATMMMILSFEGDCTQDAVKNQIITRFAMETQVKASDVQFFCGSTSLVKRRKRSTMRQITLRFNQIERGQKSKIEADPVGEMEKLKKHMESTVIDNVIRDLSKRKDWSSLNKYVRSQLIVSRAANQPIKEECSNPGDTQASSAPIGERCVTCNQGTFKNISSNACEKCPQGMYQPEPGKTNCLSCPFGTVVLPGKAKNFTSCRTMCKPGEYSVNGLTPCDHCPQGFYSVKYRSRTCTRCPTDTTTVNAGATSQYVCGSVCREGSFSETGVEPCQPCAKGYFQVKTGQVACVSCPRFQSTASKGSASPLSCNDMNDCSSNPCMNGANCVDLKDNYQCQCKPGYWGRDCELEVDECALNPCADTAKCIDKFNSYKCVCAPGTGGVHCDEIVERCTKNLCNGNGQCIDLPDFKYKCVCRDGYTGEFCEAVVDSCRPNPCQNNGICLKSSNIDKFSCRCPNGFAGATCETKVSFCSSNPCKHGTCIDQQAGYICQCMNGYEGKQCDKQINMCKHKKCHNGGECENLVADVKCRCSPGYYGEQCDQKGHSDFDLSFQSRASTSFVSIHGREDLRQLTIAFWMRTSDKETLGTPISYAARNSKGVIDDNTFHLTDYSNFNLAINNKTQSLEMDANDGEWHHIAVTWSSSNGLWKAYKDGVVVNKNSANNPFQKHGYIAKGGLFVIGEEQDSMEGDFTAEESFYGDLSQLNIWNRELSSNEIYDLAWSCGHQEGNVVAWSDFSHLSIGYIIRTTPSLVCNFKSELRQFQHLKDRDLPAGLKRVGRQMSLPNTHPLQCAKECIKNSQWCRSFTFVKPQRKCDLYTGSILITENIDPTENEQSDLFLLSCVTPLGMTRNTVQNSWITASSFAGGAYPYLARLFNTIKPGKTAAHWKPKTENRNEYIQIDFKKTMRVSGIASQGHFQPGVDEFASSYELWYMSSGRLKFYKELQGNKDSKTVQRNELHLETNLIRIYPRRNPAISAGIAMRIEFYGCPNRPQGTPQYISDINNCQNNPCKNGATCIDLYQRFQCVCAQGFQGSTCSSEVSCDDKNLDVGVNEVMYPMKISNARWIVHTSCKVGFTAIGTKNIQCSRGHWTISGDLKCVDLDECKAGYCSDGCENSHGSFHCLCPRGKQLSHNGRTCDDVDECRENLAGCQSTCSNIHSDFLCRCKPGFRIGGKRSCFDINECSAGTHNCQHLCENTHGSYKCHCQPGYKLSNDGYSCNYINCPALQKSTLMRITLKSTYAEYSCMSSFKINGLKRRYCQADGTWSGNSPKCEAIKCIQLFSPENGRITAYSGVNYGARYNFRCNGGYEMIGSSSRVCQSDSTWSGVQPLCIRNVCPSFPIINGRMVGLAKQVDSVVRVECKEGYKLVKNEYETRTCQSSGQWSGHGGNAAVVECKVIRCGNVPSTGRVQIKYTKGDVFQATASYYCLSGMCLEGDRIRRCQSNGKWSGNPPLCMTNSCCKPKVPVHSTFYSDKRYNPGNSIYVHCDKGYTTSGDAFRECQNNLQWSGTDTKCTIVNCGDPGDLVNGKHHNREVTTYKSKVKYFCKPSYVLSGSRERVCQADGKWSGTRPMCYKSINGGHIKSKSGQIKCDEGEVCHWLLQVTQGKKITIQFTTYNLNKDEDRAEIYDGQEDWDPFVTFTKTLRPRPVTSNGHFVRIITNGYVRIVFKESGCGGLLSTKTGVLTTPNFPHGYPGNLDCYWTIHRPYNRIDLRFDTFLLQQRNVDYVTMTEGPFQSSDMILNKRYGKGIPFLLKEWADRWYWVHFHSDGHHNDDGFQAIWTRYEPRD